MPRIRKVSLLPLANLRSNPSSFHILLVGNFRPDEQQSMLRFEHMLTTGLQTRGYRVSTISPTPKCARLTRSYRYAGWRKYLGYIDKFFLFPFELRRRVKSLRPDAIHIIDHANSYYARRLDKSMVLVTCHDLLSIQLACEQHLGPRLSVAGRAFQRWILRHLSRVPVVVCVSTKTQQDLIRLTGHRSVRSPVILNGLNYPFKRQPAELAFPTLAALWQRQHLAQKLGQGFLLHIGGTQWYKNRRGLLEIYAELKKHLPSTPPLLLAGKSLSPDLLSHLTALGLLESVFQLGTVTDAELEALYSLAEGLIFPSWAEGFGWPIAEAQACGCPVFTSDREPLTEVGGDAAVYFDPADPTAAARQIAASWSNRREIGARGLARANLWAPERMFAEYEQVYRHLI